MTAVLSGTDALRKDRHMSLDDTGISFSATTDWREKYNEVLDMLSETRAELDDFHQASKELEAELESELQRTEKAQQELQTKVIRAENERDDWKSKFMHLQTTHNTTTTSLQRELDQLRQEHQSTKVHLRELEMGNDDLERNERAVSSSLADMEAKYSKALEEKILLEHELLEKAGLEEETQRLRDELRDANVEISIIKGQLQAFKSREISNSSLERLEDLQPAAPSTEDLLKTSPPADLDLADISPAFESDSLTTPKASLSSKPPPPPSSSSYASRSLAQQRQGSSVTPLKNSSNVNVLRSSTTLPSFSSPSTASPRSFMKPPTPRTTSTISTATASSSTGSIAKNKGVQMVSEMRARVRNLEQKIHTRVPRLRMASSTRQTFTPSLGPMTPITSPSPVSNASNTTKSSWDSQRKSVDSRRSNDSGSDKNSKKGNGDSSGWVLIMEDSPSPNKEKEAKRLKERRRVSIPTAPTAFRPSTSTVIRATSPSLSTGPMNPMAASTGLSGGGASGSITSRPQTPTFLPLPSGLYGANSSTTASMKRSTGPGAPNPYNQFKRSSIGKSPAVPVPPIPAALRERPLTMPSYQGTSSGSSSPSEGKALPATPDDLRSNVTIRPSSRMPSTTSSTSVTSILSKSRIGRPSGGRRSGGLIETNNVLDLKDLQPRSSPTS
ncbi:hypothetical protein BJ912DRAFT_940671 [Pholiota molesta]|nr:hypothetical protein BJ912DRAFT_940671 [Pholiota molesta]